MKIVKIFSLICFLIIGVWAQSGATITGRITEDNQPVKETVILQRDKVEIERIKSDENGNFKFENLTDGNYTVVVANTNKIYYFNVPQEVVVAGGKSVEINFGFEKQTSEATSAQIKEIVTISADSRQTIDEVSKTVNTIDAKQMRDRADFALVESLKTIPGFRVQQLGGFGRTASIKTRGLRNQDTAVLIDGVRFRDASSITGDASAFLSDFTLTSVNRIEVLRGSGSSLYGTNAIGGTLDFQTPKPTGGMHGQIGGAFGNLGLGRLRGNFSDGTDDGKFAFNLGASRTVYTRGIDGADDAHNTNFQSRVEYNPFEKTNVSARFFVSDAFVRLNSNPDTFGDLSVSNAGIFDARPGVNFVSDANDPDNFQKSKFFNGQIVLTQIVNEDLVFRAFYAGLKTSRKNQNGTLGVGFQSESTSFFDGLIQTANAQFNWTPGDAHEITFGYEFEGEKFGNDGLTPSGAGDFFTRARQSSNTFYAQDLISLLGGRLQLAGGVRAQFFRLDAPAFSLNNAPYSDSNPENPPNAYTFDGAASYFFERTGTKLRAHVGNGYRVPSLYERFGTFFSSFGEPGFIALGDPELKPEKSIAFDGGVEQNLFENRAKLTAVYFYTKLTETIGFGDDARAIPGSPRPFGGYLNTKGGIARGAELSGQVKASDATDVFASYTFTNSDQRVPQAAGNPTIETFGIPKHQFTLVATQRFKRAWVNFDFLATSDYLAPIFSNTFFQTYVYRFDGNRKADLTAGYTIPFRGEKLNLRLYGTLENVFDDDYFENGFRTAGRTGRLGLSFGF